MDKDKYSKYIKMYYYNQIESIEDVKECLLKTYANESKAFKILYSFGYVTEKLKENLK